MQFSYEGMIARSQLAVLDFNSGVGLVQAETKSGKKRYKLQFSKVTQNWVVKKIKSGKEKLYLDHLLTEVNYLKSSQVEYPVPILNGVPKTLRQQKSQTKTNR